MIGRGWVGKGFGEKVEIFADFEGPFASKPAPTFNRVLL